ncbi:MAG: hypothetical protein JNM24_08835 [Bdellovibrionaceae bacterium]|jgi:hypothetical protein|nr:hypothetical protein [Pseudobdellovibrionaceae bacterium]
MKSILRYVGLFAVVLSGITFMLQGWNELTGLNKYLSFFAFVSILAGLAFLFQRQIEDKLTAKIFAVLSALGITTLVSQIGSIVYSSVKPGAVAVPEVFRFAIPMSDFLIIGLVTGLALVPIALLGFNSIIKSRFVEAALLYLALNAFLILPMRDSVSNSLFLLSQFVILFWGYKRLKIQVAIEDRWNRIGFFALLSAPILTLMIRSLYYPVNAYYFSTLFGVLGTALIFVPNKAVSRDEKEVESLFTGIGYVSLLGAWSFFTEHTFFLYLRRPEIEPITSLFFPYVLFGGMALISYLVYRAKESTYEVYKDGIIFWVNIAISHSVLNTWKFETHAVGILVAVSLTVYSFRRRFKWLLLMSGLNVILCLTYYFDFITEIYRKSPWLFYAIVGIGLILISAFYERIAKVMELLRTRQHSLQDHEVRSPRDQ